MPRWSTYIAPPAYVNDVGYCLVAAYVVKRHLSGNQLVGEDPNRPHIHLLVIVFSLQDFRRNIVEGSTVGGAAAISHSCPAEIA